MIPQFALKLSIDPAARLERMKENIARRDIPRFLPPETGVRGPYSVACYGPSLADTYWNLRDDENIITVSGAHDFLISKEIIPKYHVECDPRQHKAFFTRNPHPDVTYLIASCCHPDVFKNLEGYKVEMWHCADLPIEPMRSLIKQEEWTGSIMIGGGSTAGLRALSVAVRLGGNELNIYGMDCSYTTNNDWAGPHSGKRHVDRFNNLIAERVFSTSTQMYNSMVDFLEILPKLCDSGCDIQLHGDGMLPWVFTCMTSGTIKSVDDLLSPIGQEILREEVA